MGMVCQVGREIERLGCWASDAEDVRNRIKEEKDTVPEVPSAVSGVRDGWLSRGLRDCMSRQWESLLRGE